VSVVFAAMKSSRLAIVLVLVLAACGGSSHHTATATGTGSGTGSAAPTSGDPTCPLVVPGTSVTVEDTAHGGALVFVTTGDVDAVRTRSKQLAAAKNADDQLAAAGKPVDGMRMADMLSTHATAEAKDIDHGARVELSASQPDDLAKLQAELRMHASHLSAGSCEMAM
jgi:hypothetical protein